MPSLKDIRTRISSVKNTQQITRAMKMVSAAKLRRAQQSIVGLRPYAHRLLAVISDVAVTHRVHHPLLSASANPQKILLVVLTSDRGLCGGFNSNINKFAFRWNAENKGKYEKVDFLFIGRKGTDFFRGRGIAGVDNILNLAKDVSYAMAAGIAERLMASFTEGGYDAVYFIYNEFKSAIAQEVVCERILPVDLSKSSLEASAKAAKFSKDMLFEPEPRLIIDELLKKHFSSQVYRCMCESVAAEHGARMTSMENATKNAGEMISNLTLTYNKLRQASITKELIEITSGAEALK